uniref:(northern house mosquito) hypothetical protein n=1 Tax=Culex pipiens TaxID=7175 RepID=A0A8D8A360_CULPI
MLRHAGVTPEGRHHPVPAEAPDERTGHRGKRPGVHHPGQLRRSSTRGWWTGQEPAGRTGRARARRCHSDQHGWTEPHSFSPVCRLAHSPGRAGRLPAADQQQPQRGRGPGRRRPGPVAVARDDGAKRPDRVHHRQGRHQDRRDPPDLRRHDPDLELRGAGQRQHRPDHHHHRQSGLGRAGAVSHQHECSQFHSSNHVHPESGAPPPPSYGLKTVQPTVNILKFAPPPTQKKIKTNNKKKTSRFDSRL